MNYFGYGYCNNGYYAGWDGHGDDSEEDCKNTCLGESKCTFAAYYSGPHVIANGRKKTCSRYQEPSCALLVSKDFEVAHTTFTKTLIKGE